MRGYFAPLLPGAADYRRLARTWRSDLVAGITVGIVALPLALAFGVSSGVGAEVGLITAIIAGIVAAVFGGSNVQVSGPTGAMVVILGPIVAVQGPQVVPLLSLMAGIFVLIAGVLKIGRVVSYIPWPVIEGFTLGIAVIIFLQQVPAAFGVSPGPSTNTLVAVVEALPTVAWPIAATAIATTVAVAAIMVFLPRLNRHIPASLIAIIVVTIVVTVANLPIDRIGQLPSALPAPTFPAVTLPLVATLAGPALTIAALAAIESLLSARVAASISDTGPYDADRELVGQGLASVASGFFGGMPATGAIARTAVNLRSGAQSRLAAIIHSLVLIAVVYLATSAVSLIPLAALAGVLMITAIRMISRSTARSVITASRSDAAVFVGTAVVTVSFDLIIAVGIGIAAAAFFALRTLAASGGVHREEIRESPQPGDEEIAVFRLDGALFFGAADRMVEEINLISSVSVVILRLSQLQVLDATGARVITELVQSLERRNITVLIKGIQERHLHVATRVGVISALRHQNHLFVDLPAAIEHARSHVRRTRAQQSGAQGHPS
ncbi:SulP family inorganic anion transporter [uncultured Microbacterium sp.]|uniref:SulP family inorganic anion transporter n=1 Tax=uncultured Microbacterium sp. TaxID=191216 RepID=UPI00260BEE98|nr:SulP family inorganic anion transporter [uncultured Microbacterium sp.]